MLHVACYILIMEYDIFKLIRMISGHMKYQANKNLEGYDLTFSQMNLLMYLKKHNGSATQKEIENYLNVSHPTVVGLVKRLENNGYVMSYIDSNSKHNKIVKLTDKIELVFKEIETDTNEHNKKLLESFSEKDKNKLVESLNIVYERLIEIDKEDM